jgi:ubiquinone/menaquinone biosynthesis C-methylase UbiE
MASCSNNLEPLTDGNPAFAGISFVLTECFSTCDLGHSTVAGQGELLMTAQASTAKPYKGMGMEGGIARWYARLTQKSLDHFKEDARRMAAKIPLSGKVLEVAPGPGYFAIELAKLGAYQITGLDISRTFVEIARSNATKAGLQVDFQRGNASEMPLDNEAFDFVFCRAAFKNFRQPARALEEMYRVLVPGGQAVIIDLRRDASRKSVDEAVREMDVGTFNGLITRMTFRFMLLKRAYTRGEFEELIAKTQFREHEIREDLIGLEVSLKKERDQKVGS